MIECTLDAYWRQQEADQNREITFVEVSAATGLHRDTISRLYNRKTDRYDASVIGKLAEFFGVESGSPIPFLVLDLS